MQSLDKKFLSLAGITLVLLYLVIMAGSVVRATGSGMGCPDWPKCFGYYIPPTDSSQVLFQENHSYEKGMKILVKDTLWEATTDFHSGKTFDHSNWEVYAVNENVKFDAGQTWTEFINRLIGATNALALSLLLTLALLRIKKDKQTFFILIAGMCVMAFVIWLGAVVVKTNLAPQKITFHMMSSLALLSVVIYTRTRVSVLSGKITKHFISKKLRLLLIFGLILTVTQIIFGTQVRQQIDVINSNMSGLSRETWISQLNSIYPVHQIIAVIVILVNATLFFYLKKTKPEAKTKVLVFSLLLVMLAEYGVGVFLHNFSIPAFAQPMHLMLAMILFGIQFGLIVRTTSSEKGID